MNAPPGLRFEPAVTGGSTSPDMEGLKSAARTILWNVGVDYSPNKIARLCVAFRQRAERNGFTFFDYLANSVALNAETRERALADPDIRRVISWADPTGETAVRNVMEERGR